MLATAHFGIARTAEDDWFDTILDVDTELFVDPFLLFKENGGFWADAHARLIEHFNLAFLLVAEGNRDPRTLAFKKALALLEFREPKELCLGYTAEGTSGSGSGGKLGKLIAQAISEAIGRGLTNPNHFEELGILQERIGADRISDTTCTILKLKFVEYTQRIARAHGIPLAPHRLYAGAFDAQRQRFESPTVHAPTNPATGGPLLFVPERFLRDLPQLNKDDWWAYYENQRLRDDLNYEVMGRVDKRTIVATARAHMDSVRRWADEKETQPAQPYDLERDPKGVVQWEAAAGAFTDANPLTIVAPVDSVGFDAVIETVVEQFRLFVEEQRGWSLLWDGAKDKPEAAPQLVFYGIARNYCKANNVVIDPETDLGRGPVDFKFSGGYVHRAHLEVKKLHNGKFWNGLDLQLPAYMSSDRCRRVGSWRSDTETASNGTSAPTSCLVASGPPLRTTTETFGMRLSTRDVGRRHPSCESHPPGVSPRPPTRASPLRPHWNVAASSHHRSHTNPCGDPSGSTVELCSSTPRSRSPAIQTTDASTGTDGFGCRFPAQPVAAPFKRSSIRADDGEIRHPRPPRNAPTAPRSFTQLRVRGPLG